jgi:hypothetical protein
MKMLRFGSLIFAVLFAATANATDFTVVLVGLDGKPLVAEPGLPMTLGDAVSSALVSPFKDESPSGQEKVKRWALALRVHAAKDIELTADDITMIKNLVAKAFGPLIVGQVWEILDPASVR